jgi:hypothetical protein
VVGAIDLEELSNAFVRYDRIRELLFGVDKRGSRPQKRVVSAWTKDASRHEVDR